MERGAIVSLAHIFIAMKEVAQKLSEAYTRRDAEQVEGLKREILKLHAEAEKIL